MKGNGRSGSGVGRDKRERQRTRKINGNLLLLLLLLLSLLLSLEKKILSLRLQPCAQHMAFSSHCIPMFPTHCFLCKPCPLPTGEVTVSDTKWCVSPGPVASLCLRSLSPHKAVFLDHV